MKMMSKSRPNKEYDDIKKDSTTLLDVIMIHVEGVFFAREDRSWVQLASANIVRRMF